MEWQYRTLGGIDHSMWQWFLSNRHPVWEPLFLLLHWVGQPWVLFVVACVVALWRKDYRIPVAVGSAQLVSTVSKRVIGHPRPDAAYAWVTEHSPSMPSGHLVAITALVVTLWLAGMRKWWLPLLVPLMMIDRLYLGVHWFSDTLGGIAVGLATPLLLWALLLAPHKAK